MMKIFFSIRRRRSLTAFCIITMLALGASAASGAEDVTSESAVALISNKGEDVLILSSHGFKKLNSNMLPVPRNPSIYDVDGSVLTMKDLKVPCQALVEYRRSGTKDPELSRLEVQAYSANADTRFTIFKGPAKIKE